MIELESARLRLREAAEDDLPALLDVYLSNPEHVAASEGNGGIVGYYDLAMLQRDWWIAHMMPGRHMLGLYLKETGEAMGLIDYIEEHPSDGVPWLGLLMVHRAHQRRGLGTEAFVRLAAHFRDDLGWTALRLAVPARTLGSLAFWERLGFQPVEASGQHERAECGSVLDRRL